MTRQENRKTGKREPKSSLVISSTPVPFFCKRNNYV